MTEIILSPQPRLLGKSDVMVSPLAWGMWRFKGQDIKAARALVDAALEVGITLFDTADIYGANTPEGFGSAEALLGRVLAEDPSLRRHMIIASKAGIIPGVPYNSSRRYLESALDASLRRLGLEQLDLWQIHRPDLLTHPEEVARALEEAHRAGKVRTVGVSNFTCAQITALQAFLSLPLVSHQPEFSPLALEPLENGLLDQALQHNLAVLAWSPLGGGRIANPASDREHAVAAALDSVASEFGVSRTVAAYAWIMAHPARPIPIVGSQNPVHIREAVDAYKVRYTRQSWYHVLVASRGVRLP